MAETTNETLWILQKQLEYVFYKSKVRFDVVPELKFGSFPIDFFVVHNKLADIRLSSDEFNQKRDLLVDSENNIGAISSYIEKVNTYKAQRITLFRGQADLAEYLDIDINLESAEGPRLLAQPTLGSQVRSPEEYSVGSEWWRRYALLIEKFELKLDLKRLASRRREAHNILRQRMNSFQVKQIASRDQMERWAIHGERNHVGQNIVEESLEYRIAKVSHVMFLLENYDKFNIGIVDDNDGEYLGWNSRDIRWQVQGKDKLMLEFNIENDRTSTDCDSSLEKAHNEIRDASDPLPVYLIIQNELLARAFSQHFESLWTKIERENVDNRSVLKYFESLRNRMRALKKAVPQR